MGESLSGKECLVKYLFVSSRNFTVSSINGKTETHKSTKVLQIIEQTVKFLPNGIERFFPKIQGLWVLYSKLETIEQTDLKPFPGLKEIVLRGNQLETLDGNLFIFNLELTLVDLADNKLKIIGEHLIDPLLQLKKICLQKNICVDQEACFHIKLQAVEPETSLSTEDFITKSPVELMKTLRSSCSVIQDNIEEVNETFRLEDKEVEEFSNKTEVNF